MNRETELHFSNLPEIHVPRSKFVKPHTYTSTFSAGSLIPVFIDSDIIPGTTVNMKMASVIRMQTPLYPTYGNCYLDLMWFFIPHRLVWDNWKKFWGENDNPWYPTVNYTIPQLKTTTAGGGANPAAAKSLWDYMGLPTGVSNLSVSALPFRAYVKVFLDWYRSEPLEYAPAYSTNDLDSTYTTQALYGGVPLKANKYHDYFTSALPSPMYGSGVNIPLGTLAPVYTLNDLVPEKTTVNGKTVSSLSWQRMAGDPFAASTQYGLTTITNTSGRAENTYAAEEVTITNDERRIRPSNLWTDLAQGIGPTLMALRQAVAIDHYLELRARTGGRYVEMLRGVWGVEPSDASLQRSEYLGGKRIPINIFSQVQSSSTDATSPLGTVGAFSHTADANEYFTKSFDDFGTLMCLACVRYDHSYQQGIDRMWSRKTPYDFYNNCFNGLSEQSILNKEIYAQGTSTDDEVFGYQEYAAEYRFANSKVTGEMRSNYSTSLDAWHYADDYATLPVLGTTWIKENEMNINRTLAVPSTTADQFLADFYFKPTYVMPMPIYSVPGLETL